MVELVSVILSGCSTAFALAHHRNKRARPVQNWAVIICKKCGHKNPDGTTFCESCKAFLEWTGERAVEATKAGVKLLLVPTSRTVEPGAVGTFELSVQNTGSVVDSFVLQIPDVPWMAVDPAELSLFPGKTSKARIDARPPRDPAVPAGQLRFTAKATSRADPHISAEEMAVISVGEFMENVARLVPLTSRATQVGSHTVTIDNRGNHPMRGSVRATDPDATLAFDVVPQTFSAGPGESASVQLAVRPSDGRAVTQDTPHRFQVQVDVAGASPVLFDGTMIQVPEVAVARPHRRPWGRWAVAAAVLLLLEVGCALALSYFRIMAPRPSWAAATIIGVLLLTVEVALARTGGADSGRGRHASPIGRAAALSIAALLLLTGVVGYAANANVGAIGSGPPIANSPSSSVSPTPVCQSHTYGPNGAEVAPGPDVPAINTSIGGATRGQTVQLTGSGFQTYTHILIELERAGNHWGAALYVTPDASGAFVKQFAVPADAPLGCDAVVARTGYWVIEQALTVRA